MNQSYRDEEDYEEAERDSQSRSKEKDKGHSADYEKKRKRAEMILEKARLRELLGYDIDY